MWWRRVAAGTASTGGVTVAVFVGLPYLVMLVGILILFGMWVWCDRDRTKHFNSSLTIMLYRSADRPTRQQPQKKPPAIEDERKPRAA